MRVRITLVKSPIGSTQQHRLTLASLGLRRLGSSVEREDTPSLRGQVRRVANLVRVEPLEEGDAVRESQ